MKLRIKNENDMTLEHNRVVNIVLFVLICIWGMLTAFQLAEILSTTNISVVMGAFLCTAMALFGVELAKTMYRHRECIRFKNGKIDIHTGSWTGEYEIDDLDRIEVRQADNGIKKSKSTVRVLGKDSYIHSEFVIMDSVGFWKFWEILKDKYPDKVFIRNWDGNKCIKKRSQKCVR